MRSGWFLVRIFIALTLILIVNYILRDYNPYVLTLIDLLIVAFSDPIDSWPVRLVEGNEWNATYEYAVYDKLTDLFLWGFVITNHLMRVGIQGAFEVLLIVAWIYRMIGVGLFIASNDGALLVWFPSMFEVFILYLFLKYLLLLPNAIVIPITTVAVPIKVVYEYWHHVIAYPQE